MALRHAPVETQKRTLRAKVSQIWLVITIYQNQNNLVLLRKLFCSSHSYKTTLLFDNYQQGK
jgi:hypothetical protein